MARLRKRWWIRGLEIGEGGGGEGQVGREWDVAFSKMATRVGLGVRESIAFRSIVTHCSFLASLATMSFLPSKITMG